MDFHILGPLEVLDDGRAVALGGSTAARPARRCCSLHANETLTHGPADRRALGRAGPTDGGRTLHVQVSRLRKALADGARAAMRRAARSSTHEHGYALVVERSRLDAHRFEDLVAEGGRELAAGRPAPAASALERALALWRGAPLADLAYERFAQREIARLEELRVGALEQLDRRAARARPARRRGRAAAGADRRAPLPRAVARPADARALPLRPAGGRAAGVPGRAARARRGAGDRAGRAAARARTRDARARRRARGARHGGAAAAARARGAAAARRRPGERAHGRHRRLRRPRPARRRSRSGSTRSRCTASSDTGRRAVPTCSSATAERSRSPPATRSSACSDCATATRTTRCAPCGPRSSCARRRVGASSSAIAAPPSRCGVGIDSGEVFVGAGRGTSARVRGDAMHVAAALGQAAADGEILARRARPAARGARTFARERARAARGPRPPGGGAAWRLLGLAVDEPLARSSSATPFVARERELAALHAALARARPASDRCRLVTVVGPPGIGKSRLAREFVAGLGDERDRGRRPLPLLRRRDHVPPARRDARAGSRASDPEQWMRARARRRRAGRDDRASRAGRDRPRRRVGQPGETFWAMRRLFEAVARERPLVVVVEDAHWADPTLLDLLEYVARVLERRADPAGLPRAPGAARGASGLGGAAARLVAAGARAARPRPDARALVEAARRGRASTRRRATRIVATAEGNPLFLEQLLGGERGGAARRRCRPASRPCSPRASTGSSRASARCSCTPRSRAAASTPAPSPR